MFNMLHTNYLGNPACFEVKILISRLDNWYQLIPYSINHDEGRLLLCLFNRYPLPG